MLCVAPDEVFDIVLQTYKELIARQYEASLCMLSASIESCSSTHWDAPVVDMKFCQVAFHALFFTDLYLDHDWDSQREQPFHRGHANIFAGYEELEDRLPVASYEKPFISSYLQHCREKAARVVAAETNDSLGKPTVFKQRLRAELHVINIRHIHHHAAQLALHLRMETGEGIEWVGSNWVD